jgi:hypothetical protein
VECGIIITMFGMLNTPWFRRLACLMLLTTQLPGTLWLLFNAQAMQALFASLAGGLLGSHLRLALHHRGDGLFVMILSARLIEMATPDDHVRQLLNQGLVPLMVVVLWPTGPGRWSKSAHAWLIRNSWRWSSGIPIHSPAMPFVWKEAV